MRFSKCFLIWLTGFVLLGSPVCTAASDTSYVVEETGRSTWRSLLDRRFDTPAEHWEYAREQQDKGRLKKAGRLMTYLVRRWPNSMEAPWAQRARADMLFARKKYEAAFNEYQFLIDNYSGRMLDYDAVLQSQFEIAEYFMNRRRMRWIFGGYRAPEYSVDYFESVIRNGPQWKKASEAQYLIGMAYMENDELEMAISAFSMLGYRYPESTFAEEAAWKQIVCLNRLRKEYPRSVETLDRTLTATTVFLVTYPDSKHLNNIKQLRNSIYEIKAGQAFNEAEFYAEVPKKAEAAIIYYEKMIEEYPKSKRVPKARARIEELRRLIALPEQDAAPVAPRSRPLPFVKESN
jgi:outer membrane protein assembly factor BamD (BamD/ComL family)